MLRLGARDAWIMLAYLTRSSRTRSEAIAIISADASTAAACARPGRDDGALSAGTPVAAP
jgi:hypothetical protein